MVIRYFEFRVIVKIKYSCLHCEFTLMVKVLVEGYFIIQLYINSHSYHALKLERFFRYYFIIRGVNDTNTTIMVDYFDIMLTNHQNVKFIDFVIKNYY